MLANILNFNKVFDKNLTPDQIKKFEDEEIKKLKKNFPVPGKKWLKNLIFVM